MERVTSKKTLKSLPCTTPAPPTRDWQLVEADHTGPFSSQVGGNTYITLFIEVAKDVGFVFERKNLRGEDSADLLATVDNLARKSSNGIENLRTDEGGDWKSAEVATVAQDRGIHHEHALVNAHGRIGKVERFRYYQECADAILRQCGAPPKFKFMAIKFINYVQNHIKRGETSRVYDLLGVDSAVVFYPFWSCYSSCAKAQARRPWNGEELQTSWLFFSAQGRVRAVERGDGTHCCER